MPDPTETQINPEVQNPIAQRNFLIPGCYVQIVSEKDDGVPVNELLSLIFSLANSNPEAKVDFWIKILSPGDRD